MTNETKWQVFRSRYIPAVLPIEIYWSWNLKKKLGHDVGKIVSVWDKGDYKAIWEEKGFKSLAEYAFNYLLNNINNLNKIRKEGIDAGQKVIKDCKDFAEKVENAEYKKFLHFLEKIEKVHNYFTEKSMLVWIFTGGTIERKLTELMKNHKEDEKKDILKIMSLTKTESYSQIEEKEFKEIVNLAREKGIEKIKKEIKEFSEKYFWFPYEYVGPETWDEKKIEKRVEDALKDKVNPYEKINVNKLQSDCIKKYNLSKEIIDLFNILQTVTLMQDDRKMAHSQICYYLNQIILGNLAKRWGVTIEQIRYMDIGLLREFIDNDDIKKIRFELKKRQEFMILVQEGTISTVYYGDKAKDKLHELRIEIDDEIKDIKELKGQPANPGKIKGKARILKTSSNVDNFEEGNIIVTGMTTPDFVGLIKKAAAIVTDEGGVTCHAAIVSRELKKPCIVGTKIATKVLKDGMEVEVDADKGTVKILKRK